MSDWILTTPTKTLSIVEPMGCAGLSDDTASIGCLRGSATRWKAFSNRTSAPA